MGVWMPLQAAVYMELKADAEQKHVLTFTTVLLVECCQSIVDFFF